MRVVRATRFGGPEVLVAGEAPDPVAGPGQVVVDVAVAALDFVQTQLRGGVTPGPPLPEPPYVPGGSVAGLVTTTGPGVDPAWIGRRVVAHTAGGYGSNAERAVAAVGALIPVPDGMGLDVAAALLDDGGTALGLVEGAGIRPDEWVLVEAAAGGLGSLLVQLARAAGARVVGAARGPAKLDLAKQVGADVVVDYSEPGWAERVREATGGGPDLVFDGVGGTIGREAFGVTARGGRFSVHGASSGAATVIDEAEALRNGVAVIGIEQLHGFQAHAHDRATRALAEAAAGRLRPVIGRTFPLERASSAHAAMEAREVLGKTLLVL
ncbi:zinc-binding dehydrogenase [Umezawaea sp. Da 62-37]|uniref:zinc-binding dehydrogenase n=1 Tax=Umezawaea sp. Da 62-37 TaxID=3075927 RepID=UPI0028F6E7D6|nr:zinc-binding dehydrogenase [Umezawaea sp. Da 62-37]WNV89858.1 zinc-binding dehydrogenase [Umezawaea sp. Da 62-37]